MARWKNWRQNLKALPKMKTDKDQSCRIIHFDIYGEREDKYNFLDDNSISAIQWNELVV